MSCVLCEKHQKSLNDGAGDLVFQSKSWFLYHYPQAQGERVIRGHLLLECRRHITDLSEMDESEAAELGSIVRSAVKLIRDELKAEHVYMFRINDKVPHLHVHLIPRYPLTPKQFWGNLITDWSEGPRVGVDGAKVLVGQLRDRFGKIV